MSIKLDLAIYINYLFARDNLRVDWWEYSSDGTEILVTYWDRDTPLMTSVPYKEVKNFFEISFSPCHIGVV